LGHVVTEHITPLQPTDGPTDLVADSALDRAENLQKLGETGIPWITRVPATVTDAHEALAHAPPDTMAPLGEDYREHVLASTDGGGAQRWLLCDAAQRRPQAQRSVDTHGLKQREAEAQALQQLCRTAFAWAADAQQALTTFAHGLQAASVPEGPSSPRPRSSMRGRPGHDTAPVPVVSHMTGALTSSLAAHEALIAPQSGFILATHALDEHRLPPQALLAGYKGQQRGERGVRFWKDPRFLAAALSRKKPERIMALLMVMTVCLLVYAALEYRIRKALKDHQASFPNQTGQPVQNPTARWVFQYVVGIHLRRIRGTGAFVLNLNDQHPHLLRLRGRPYEAFYS
jgi:transposase